MVESKIYLSLDFQDFSTNHMVPLKRGETGKKVIISLSDGGFPYHIEDGCYAVLTGEKPDGNVLFNHCDIDKDTIVYDVTEQTTTAAGRILAAINLYGPDDMLLVSAKFRILVDGTVFHDGKVESEPDVSALTHLISDARNTIDVGNRTIQDCEAATEAAETATTAANEAAGAAQEQAAAAGNAASAANDAAGRAETAAAEVNTAKENADTAAEAANTAAAAAQAQATTAENAANSANASASRADAASAAANTAKENADTAAATANTAAAAAQEQATAARNAASAANATAGRADDSAAGANAAKDNANAAAVAANTAAAAAQAVVDGIVPEVNQLKSDLAAITPDDAAIDGKPWTSRKIVDSLCQPFEETGNPVQCYPVENYPLGVKVQIEPKQDGDGDPSPENVRQIVGWDAVNITHSNDAGESDTYDITMPETVYGGELDLETGVLTVDRCVYTITGNEKWGMNSDGSIRCLTTAPLLPNDIFADAIYTHYATGTMFKGQGMLSMSYKNSLLLSFNAQLVSEMGYTVETLVEYLRNQYAAGTPVKACYCVAAPYTIQLTPQQITAMSGVNAIYTDADGVIVTGRENPQHTITELKNAILSLGGNI